MTFLPRFGEIVVLLTTGSSQSDAIIDDVVKALPLTLGFSVVVVVDVVVDVVVVVVERMRCGFVSERGVVLRSVEKRRLGVDDRGGMLEYFRVPFVDGAFVLLSYDSVELCFDSAYDLVE